MNRDTRRKKQKQLCVKLVCEFATNSNRMTVSSAFDYVQHAKYLMCTVYK